jgi:hypothetical protein
MLDFLGGLLTNADYIISTRTCLRAIGEERQQSIL